ncbi:alginate O-acetyltransferase complex protein AlgI [Paenibacillus shirakamiensis]|uniref:Alginate O-acetyltransferase complex protein AlgI n=1 Tax=Paenibacillus shirakamiensis TaxID=1265935 RepID=A0ABS4JIF8_9BACL|nr:MBOAT family protein [Paenibacillus shirakamiensis]MBP2000756.1 alginate O-acetyltransferase complex protein AlgI [Paenibacillus shirakamiensis]
MVFSSLLFLFLFLPVVLLLYYVAPGRLKNLILLGTSLVFYAWGEPVYIVIMLFSTLMDYSFGLLLSRPKLTRYQRKWIIAGSILVNLALLSYFKYADFLIHTINQVLGTQIPLTDLPLPIGISFYTFQSMSYIVDIYRGTAKAQRNWLDFATFVALFPQLVAGPIVQYSVVADQIKHRTVDIDTFAEGVRRFIIGLAKKVLLANNIGLLWHGISQTDTSNMSILMAWLGIIAFAFQIYFDFSGYSDMAIGLGLMFGFHFNENFNRPYAARSITDFWRRWHISLSSWFRDYLYIPLGGNRRGLPIQLRNIMIVWVLTGLWHGASWNFLLWGFYFGVILSLEKLGLLRLLNRLPAWIAHGYALILILVGWVFFAFEQWTTMTGYLSAMLGMGGQHEHHAVWDNTTLYLLYTNILLLIITTLASIPWENSRIYLRWMNHPYVQLPVLGVLFFLSSAYLVDATFNPFLYFRF